MHTQVLTWTAGLRFTSARRPNHHWRVVQHVLARAVPAALFALPLVAVVSDPPAARAALYWDANGATAGAGGPSPAGTWGTNNFWSGSAAGTAGTGPWPIGGNSAVFSAGSDATGTFTVGVFGTQIVGGGITFEEGNVTLSSVSSPLLVLSGANPIAVTTSQATIDVPIGGTGSLSKTGAGTLILGTANSYGGGTTISQGTLQMNNVAALSSGNVTLSGGALAHNFTDAFAHNGKTLTMSAPTTLSVTGGNQVNFWGSLSGGNNALTVNGGGTFFLGMPSGGTVSNLSSITVTGNTILGSHSNAAGWGGSGTPVNVHDGSSLGINDGAVMPNPIALNGTTNGSGALFSYSNAGGFSGPITLNATSGVGGANNFGISGNVSGNGGLTKLGSGTVTLSGSVSYIGGTIISAGTLYVVDYASVPPGQITIQSGAAFSLADLLGYLVPPITLSGSGNFNFQNQFTSLTLTNSTFAGTINGPGGVSTTGTCTFTGGSNTQHVTTVSSGTLFINGDAALGGGFATCTLSARLALLNSCALGPKYFNFGGGSELDTNGFDATTFDGIILGAMKKTGNGSLNLTGDATSVLSVEVAGGTLVLGGDDKISDDAAVTISNGTTLNIGGFSDRVGNVSMNGNISGFQGSGFGLGATSFALHSGTASAPLTDPGLSIGAVTVDGPVTLSGMNTYTGGTTVSSGGVLTVSSDANLSFLGALALQGGGTFRWGSAFALGAARDGAITMNAGGGKFDSNGLNVSIFDPIGGNGSLTKVGAGTLVLSAANTYAGGTSVSAGTLQLDNASAPGSGDITLAGGTLLHNFTEVFAHFGKTLTLTAPSTIGATPGRQINFWGTLAGGGNALTVNGGGLFFLGEPSGAAVSNLGSISVTGNTTLGSDTNAAGWGGTAGSPGTGPTITVADGSSLGVLGPVMPNPLVLSGTTTGSGALFAYSSAGGFSGPVMLNATSGVGGVSNFTVSGNIGGAGGLTKLGSSAITLSGTNIYGGLTSIDGGTLSVTGSLTNTFTAVNAGGTLGGNGSVRFVNVQSGGALAPGLSVGTLHTGSMQIDDGAKYIWEVNNGSSDRVAIDQGSPGSRQLAFQPLSANLTIQIVGNVSNYVSGVPVVYTIATFDSHSGSPVPIINASAFTANVPGVWTYTWNTTSLQLTYHPGTFNFTGDLDSDGDVDAADLTLLTSCKTRDKVPHNGTTLCQNTDFDDDNDVDLSDFGRFQQCYSGASQLPPASCGG